MPNESPDNGFLGQEQLFKVGDLVEYRATPYWKDGGMWRALEGVTGRVTSISAHYPYVYARERQRVTHPFKYSVDFEGEERNLTPAPENLHHAGMRDPEWQL